MIVQTESFYPTLPVFESDDGGAIPVTVWTQDNNSGAPYMVMYSYAYKLGYTDKGHTEYVCEGMVRFNNTFTLRQQDELVLMQSGAYLQGYEFGRQGYHQSYYCFGGGNPNGVTEWETDITNNPPR